MDLAEFRVYLVDVIFAQRIAPRRCRLVATRGA